jgi:pyruvate dehydrogenase E1 component beta subunit/2-oxoisovalerate dehydrogenase E1 component beta subunit
MTLSFTCEHKYLYYHLKADKLPDKGLPTGRARIAREGRDLTIVSYSAMTQESLAAAEELSREGLELEVVDLRTVKPLDTDTVLASVATHRPFALRRRIISVGRHERGGHRTGHQPGFHLLDAAPQRLNAKDTPIPYHPNLWSAHRPNAKKIVAKARALLRE